MAIYWVLPDVTVTVIGDEWLLSLASSLASLASSASSASRAATAAAAASEFTCCCSWKTINCEIKIEREWLKPTLYQRIRVAVS